MWGGGGVVWARDGDLTANTVSSVWCLSVSDNARVRTFDVDCENPGAKVLSLDCQSHAFTCRNL